MHLKLPFIFLTFLFFSISALSQNEFVSADKEKVAKTLEKQSVSISSISSSFSQEKHISQIEMDIHSEGVFYFSKPNKIRWEYQKPYSYIILINGDSLTIINDDAVNKIDVQNNAIFKEINKLILASISGDVFDNPDFLVSVFENRKFYKIELKPKTESISQIITQMELFIDKSEGTVQRIKMFETGDDFSEMIFFDTKNNEILSDTIFCHN